MRRGQPSDIATGNPHDSLEERLSPFIEYPYRVGPLSRRAKRTEVSLSLSHSFRKFLGLQVFPSSKPVQMPEGSKGQNDRRQMSRSSTKSKSYQLHSYPIAMVSRNATFRWHKNYAPCRPLKCPQAKNCRSKFGCSQDRLSCCSKSRRSINPSWSYAECRRANRLPSLPDFTEMTASYYGSHVTPQC